MRLLCATICAFDAARHDLSALLCRFRHSIRTFAGYMPSCRCLLRAVDTLLSFAVTLLDTKARSRHYAHVAAIGDTPCLICYFFYCAAL